MEDENKTCDKCDNDAMYYVSVEKRIVPLNITLVIDKIPLDKKFSSYQLCKKCAEKEQWDLDENKPVFRR